MAFSRTLPNGQIIDGIPDGTSEEQIRAYALKNGLATEADFNLDQKTKADYISTLTETGGAVGGAIYGASLGSAVGPVGTFVGGLVGGAVGAGVGYFSGELAESYVEDRDFDVEQATDESFKAAGKDALFSAGFGVVGKGIKEVYKPLSRFFSPKYFSSQGEAAATDVALSIQRGERTLDDVVASGEYSEAYLKEVIENLGKRGEELAMASDLNRKLMEKGAGLLPVQAVPESRVGRFGQDYASSSLLMKQEYENTLKIQDKYIVDQFSEILGRSTDDLTRQETGEVLIKLVEDSDTALKAVVSPLYRAIDKEGAVFLRTGNVKNRVTQSFNKFPKQQQTATAKSVMKTINDMGDALSPKEVYKQLKTLRDLKGRIGPDPAANAMIAVATKNLRNIFNANKNIIRPTAAINRGKAALDELITKEGTTGILGKHKQIANMLTRMRPHMSFSEAHQELSTLKALQRDMERSLGEKSSKAEKLIGEAIEDLSRAMDDTAKNFNPALLEKYKGVSGMYREGINTIHGGWISKALKKDNVADIGQYLVKSGENLAVTDLRKLLAKAKELGTAENGENMVKSIEKEFINNLFPAGSPQSFRNFLQKMEVGKFRDTFNAIVSKEKGDKLLQLAREVDLMSKGVEGSEAALSLAVRAGELGAVRNPGLGSLLYPLFSTLARKQLNPKEVQKKINLAKAMNAKLQKGEKIPAGMFNSFIEGLPNTAAITGLVVGAQVPNE